MKTYLVSANLLKVAMVHNVSCSKDAIIECQTHLWDHKPTLFERLKDAEWLATADIPPVDPLKVVVEFIHD